MTPDPPEQPYDAEEPSAESGTEEVEAHDASGLDLARAAARAAAAAGVDTVAAGVLSAVAPPAPGGAGAGCGVPPGRQPAATPASMAATGHTRRPGARLRMILPESDVDMFALKRVNDGAGD